MYFFRKKVRQKSSAPFNLKGVSKKLAVYNTFFSLYDKLKKVLPEKLLPPKRYLPMLGIEPSTFSCL